MSDSQRQPDAFSEKKLAYFKLRLKQKGISIPEEQTIPCRKEASPCPLSFAQQRLWFLEQFEPGTSTYNVPTAIRLKGTLNLIALEQSVDEIIQRHEVLRTIFSNQAGRPIQVITPGHHVLTRVNLQYLSESEQETIVHKLATDEARRPFNLSTGPLLRWHLLMLKTDEYVLLFTMHHIVSDGWSIEILIREMGLLYAAFEAGQPSPLPALPIQYGDYALWQRAWLQGAVLEHQVSYWRKQLSDLPTLAFPTDHPHPTVPNYQGASVAFTLSRSLSEQLKGLSQREGTTLFMTLLASFQILLARYCGQDDIVVGTPIANRRHQELEGLIGFFVNMLVMRCDLSGNPTFQQVLARVREVCLGAYAHQDVPFEKLVEVLQPERNLNRHPLFQVFFGFLPAFSGAFATAELQMEPLAIEIGAAKYDLSLLLQEQGTGQEIMGVFEYNIELFERETIQRLVEHFKLLLSRIVANVRYPIQTLPLLSEAEEEQILFTWNATWATYPTKKCPHHLIEEQAAQTPDAVAVIYEESQLTYAELNARANQLAHYLQKWGVGPEVLVGVCLERSLELAICLVAILKVGGAYVPLDPAYPEERLMFMVQDARVACVIVREMFPAWMTTYKGQCLSLKHFWPELDAYSTAFRSVAIPEQLAYMIYTSGSTGKPKGAMNQHGSLCNRLYWMQRAYPLTSTDRVLQKTPLSFDVSVWEFFWPLCFGAGLVMAPPGAHQDPYVLAQLLRQYAISVLHFVPSMLSTFLSGAGAVTNGALRHVICSGEALSPTLQERFFALYKTQLHNLYGPTEAAIDVTAWNCVPGQKQPFVPIGHPIANIQIYLLSAMFQPVPIGVVGELFIGGVGVARGYWQRPELTAERFLPDPFSGIPGAHLYRTGDLARYLPDGTLVLVGRVDSQIKLRGFRIELGEIEAVLQTQPGVVEAAVLLREDQVADPHLVAYVVPFPARENSPQPFLSLAELRRQMSRWLPDYMLPSHLVLLERLPLQPNGKLDYRSLPIPDRNSAPQRERAYVAPHSPMEELLVGLWQEILEVEQIGIEDHFFELGGHSLLATQLVSRLREILAREVPLQLLFAHLTISTLARELERILQDKDEGTNWFAPPLLPREKQAMIPLSFAQERLWFLAQLVPENPFYNMPMALRLRGDLQEAVLYQSINALVTRHEALRTTFPTLQGFPIQSLASSLAVNLSVIDLQDIHATQREALVLDLSTQEALLPFDLANELPFRISLLRLAPQEHVVLLTLHHIIADGWSLQVLSADLTALYAAFEAGQPSLLPALPIQYGDYALWQREWLQGAVLEHQVSYWRKQLSDLPTLAFPTDHPHLTVPNYQGASVAFTLSRSLSEQLKGLSQREGTTLFMTLLASFQILLARYCGQDDIVVGTPIANRRHRELEGLIGFFVNMLVMRCDLSGNPTFQQVLARVREVCLGAYTHQDVPFEKLVEVLQPERDLNRHPLFQVSFQLLQSQARPEPRISFPHLHLIREEVEEHVARFDLEIDLFEDHQSIEGSLLYNTSLFEAASITRLVQHWHILLEAIVASPKQRLWQLPLLTFSEEEQQVHTWNATQVAYPFTQCLHHLLEEQVARTPDALAVVSQENCLTYAALNARANQLAHFLRGCGVGPEVLVGVCLQRSLELVISLLAILKAGGAYVPLDPEYPEKRLSFMIQDAQVSLILTQEALSRVLTKDRGKCLWLEQIWPKLQMYPITNEYNVVTSQQLAYVIYTSGSTGQPKGVQVTHDNLMHSTLARIQYYQEPVKSFLLLSSIAFDSSVAGIFWTLYQGGRLILPSIDQAHDVYALSQLIVHQRISHLLTVPSFYRLLLTQKVLYQVHSLQVSIVAGETCPRTIVKQHYDCLPYTTIFNEYGLSETSVWCSVHKPQNEEMDVEAIVPIGRPIANTQIYLLSAMLQLVPVGVVGELYIGGVGVGRGYKQRPVLTAERFLPDPFSDTLGARLYRTGDLARYQSDGSLEFVGRVDSQIKLRGFRIELGEIEAVLRALPEVDDAVVLLREEQSADPYIVAYIVPAVSEQLALSTSENKLLSSHWQTVFEETYLSSQLSQDQSPIFNITGWLSSYTHQPLPSEEMTEWVEQTLARITALQPQRILEIGCGTGLLLYRLAPGVQEYWGTDFSAHAIQNLQDHLANQMLPLAHLRLEQRTADNWTGMPHDFFDLVILNSVVQYFPSLDYLLQVLEQAIYSLTDGGAIFVGDVRSLPLLEAFHTSVVLYRASATLLVGQAQEQVRRRMQQEEELVIDPDFFDWLPQRLPQIRQVHISPRRGWATNEVTRFRYDVVLEIAASQTSDIGISTSGTNEKTNTSEEFVWLELSSLRQIAQVLEGQQLPQVGLSHVPNKRVQSAVKACQILQGADPEQRVFDILPHADEQGIDPEELWVLGEHTGYRVEMNWSGHDRTGAYDVLFWREAMQTGQEIAAKIGKRPRLWHVPHEVKKPLSWGDYATKPWQVQEQRTLVPRLRQQIGEQLPAHMVPATFVLLEQLPLMPNGKLDRRALPSQAQGYQAAAKEYISPRDPREKLLAEIWQEVLGSERIGSKDHFFELGGHSLLAIQVVARARQAGLPITLSSLFQYPILADLATFIKDKALFQSVEEPDTHSEVVEEPRFEKRTPQRHEVLVDLQPSGSKRPFFCIPPILGEPTCYTALAQAMNPDYPLYGLRAAGLQGEREPFTSIEEIATYYVEAILAHDSEGPYALGGWSFGGLVAFEMALQLQRQGARVALLTLIDTFAPPFNRHELTQEETTEISTFLAENLLQCLSYLPEQKRPLALDRQNLHILSRLEQMHFLQDIAKLAGVDEFIRVGYASFLAMERYQPQGKYEGSLLLLQASINNQHNTIADGTYGWKQLTSHPIRVQVVPGTHDMLINEPSVSILAHHLQENLDNALR